MSKKIGSSLNDSDILEDIVDNEQIYLREGTIVFDSRLTREPDLALDRLLLCVEDNIVVNNDNEEEIEWDSVLKDYKKKQEPIDPPSTNPGS